jgi:hypothetical protein
MARPARVQVAPGVRARELVPALALGAQDAARVPALVQARAPASASVLVPAQGSVRARVPEALAQVLLDAAALARAEGVQAWEAQALAVVA